MQNIKFGKTYVEIKINCKKYTYVFLRFIFYTIITRYSYKNGGALSTRSIARIESNCIRTVLPTVFYSLQQQFPKWSI